MIFRAPEPPVSIPAVALTPFLLASAAARGAAPALIDGPSGRTLTFEGWASGVRRVAAGLARRGLRKGDVLAILSPNLPEYALAFHGVALAGGVNTTMNPLYTVAEIQQQLRDSRARYLVTVPPFLAKAKEAAAGTEVREIFVFGNREEVGDATPFADLTVSDDATPEVPIDPARDLVALPYSSGTTGLPKGVMLSHRNLVANTLQSASVLHIGPGDVVLGVLPFFHIYGMVVIMNLALYKGATIVTLPRFDFEQCLEVLQRYRITFANIVPPLVLALAKHPLVDRYDLSALHTIFSGAAPLGEPLARAAHERLGCAVLQGYGLTETSPVTHATRHTDPHPKLGGIGPPIPNTEAKIVDVETGRDLDPNQEGEICIRGPQVMQGYLNRPDATTAMIDAEGWLHTGDIGYADPQGCFFVVDRVKEMIKYKGMQVAPAELEAVLLSHPAVADAAVIPLDDEEAGQVPKAFLVLRAEVASDEICRFVAERVAPHKKLRAVEITDQIPKSASGKILRRVLIERERGRG
jgi:acyl-CoA synthetase (AMP-forming)/AMP-acid ligase II